jgi:hypothetical protein
MEKQNEPAPCKKENSRKFPFRVSSKKYLAIIAAFTLVGVGGGFAYYWYIGCNTGGCAITSSPYMSMIWGGMMGYLLPDFLVKKVNQEETGA